MPHIKFKNVSTLISLGTAVRFSLLCHDNLEEKSVFEEC